MVIKRKIKFFFGKIVGDIGPVTTNLFASRVTFEVSRCYISTYTSEPKAIGIDAFCCHWNNENFYAFLPFSVISKVLSKIETEMTAGVLIVPLSAIQS